MAAGSVVTKDVPTGSVVGGNPARVLGAFANFEQKAKGSFVSDSEIAHIHDYKTRVFAAIDMARGKEGYRSIDGKK